MGGSRFTPQRVGRSEYFPIDRQYDLLVFVVFASNLLRAPAMCKTLNASIPRDVAQRQNRTLEAGAAPRCAMPARVGARDRKDCVQSLQCLRLTSSRPLAVATACAAKAGIPTALTPASSRKASLRGSLLLAAWLHHALGRRSRRARPSLQDQATAHANTPQARQGCLWHPRCPSPPWSGGACRAPGQQHGGWHGRGGGVSRAACPIGSFLHEMPLYRGLAARWLSRHGNRCASVIKAGRLPARWARLGSLP